MINIQEQALYVTSLGKFFMKSADNKQQESHLSITVQVTTDQTLVFQHTGYVRSLVVSTLNTTVAEKSQRSKIAVYVNVNI